MENYTITVTLVYSPIINASIGLIVTTAVIRIIRWILDILP